jgi:hypothetical protein
MLTINFVNDGTAEFAPIEGHYNYVVLVNGKEIARGRVEKHNRLSGWQGLVSCLAKNVYDEDSGVINNPDVIRQIQEGE